jgi:hypothetical protein
VTAGAKAGATWEGKYAATAGAGVAPRPDAKVAGVGIEDGGAPKERSSNASKSSSPPPPLALLVATDDAGGGGGDDDDGDGDEEPMLRRSGSATAMAWAGKAEATPVGRRL